MVTAFAVTGRSSDKTVTNSGFSSDLGIVFVLNKRLLIQVGPESCTASSILAGIKNLSGVRCDKFQLLSSRLLSVDMRSGVVKSKAWLVND